ncbi:MAG TPA: MFS transporter [Dongiaceae bacterium]|jgi:predicted MFS family arabinose efflux permease|nr:MFS transporter [Dongiaceae bacterium]
MTTEVALSAPASHLLRLFTVALIAFLTLVDLFATQAILPSLVKAYGVTPAAMGFAVNASTMGMAVAGLVVAAFSRRINRRRGIVLCLMLLAIPTALLATLPDLPLFTVLRIIQGLFMSGAFSLTLAYLAENSSARETASALAAYVTGNVASNLFGRLMSASVADHLGLPTNFYMFAGLNLVGAILAYATLTRVTPMGVARAMARSPLAAWSEHLRNGPLRAAFGIGFCILFAFIGTFTYVNFVVTRPPFSIGMMQLGLVYFVFVPSILSTPLAGLAVGRFGTRPTFWMSLGLAAVGLPMLMTSTLAVVLAGLALVAVGTFFAQAAATGFVGRAATGDRGSAGGLYLASYFLGGLAGSFVLGRAFDAFGWGACVTGVGAALALAASLAIKLRLPEEDRARRAESFC